MTVASLESALGGLSVTASSSFTAAVAGWESTKPWDASRADIEDQNVPFIRAGRARGTETATYEVNGTIIVKDDWFAYPSSTRRAVLYHEAGHGLETDAEGSWGKYGIDNPLDIYDWPKAPNLGHNYGEIIAEAYSVIWTDPSWFNASWNTGLDKVRDLVIRMAKDFGYPLPAGVHTAAVMLRVEPTKDFPYKIRQTNIESVEALLDGKWVGGLWWMPAEDRWVGGSRMVDGELVDAPRHIVRQPYIGRVEVKADHRRKGVATAMLKAARVICPDLQHSGDLTPDAVAWSAKVGGLKGDLPEGLKARLIKLNKRQETTKLVAYTDEHPAGIGEISWFGNGEIYIATVDEPFRRRGVASWLLAKAREIDPRIHHSSRLTEDAKAWSAKVSLRRAAALHGDKLFWRFQPLGREFIPETASSSPFLYRNDWGREHAKAGFSCSKSPWGLFIYGLVMGWLTPGGKSKAWQDDVIGFTGKVVGIGVDGEPLVAPDMGVVLRYTFAQYVAELLTTQFPARYGWKVNDDEGNWKWLAKDLATGKGDFWRKGIDGLAPAARPAADHIIETFAPEAMTKAAAVCSDEGEAWSQHVGGPSSGLVPFHTFPVVRPNSYGPRDVELFRPAKEDMDDLSGDDRKAAYKAIALLRAGRIRVEPKERPPLIGAFTIRATSSLRVAFYLSTDDDWHIFWIGNHNYEEAERRFWGNPALLKAAGLSRVASGSSDLIHRGVRVTVDPAAFATASPAQRATMILAARAVTNPGLGRHWSTDEDWAQRWVLRHSDFSTPASVHVVLTARMPPQSAIETDPEILELHGVGMYQDEPEVPLVPGTPLTVTKVSWYDMDEDEWFSESVSLSRTSSLSTGSSMWWRIHPSSRKFSVEDATSTTFQPVDGKQDPRPGYSCFASPWHLYFYLDHMRMGSRSEQVVGFSGARVGTGNDDEPLVMPDMSTVHKVGGAEFVSELMTTPLPPSPRFAPWAPAMYSTWETLAKRFKYLDQDDPVQDFVVSKYATAKTAMPVGPPPAGVRYLFTSNSRGNRNPLQTYCILGAVLDGQVIGYLTWGIQGRKVQEVWVDPARRRRRIAETMFAVAKDFDPAITHHVDRSDDGDAWARATSTDAPVRESNTVEDHEYPNKPSWTLTDRILGDRADIIDLTPGVMRAAAAREPWVKTAFAGIVDYKDDRPLTGGQAVTITSLMPGTTFTDFHDVPFANALDKAMGTNRHDDSLDEYLDARSAWWKSQPATTVPMSAHFVVTQNNVNTARVDQIVMDPKTGGKEPIWMVRDGGRYYTMNGHHRLVADFLRGEASIPARVVEMSSLPKVASKTASVGYDEQAWQEAAMMLPHSRKFSGEQFENFVRKVLTTELGKITIHFDLLFAPRLNDGTMAEASWMNEDGGFAYVGWSVSGLNEWIALHECAHVIDQHGGYDDGHGPKWRQTFRQLLSKYQTGTKTLIGKTAEFVDPEFDTPEPQYGWHTFHGANDLWDKGTWRAMFGDGVTTITPWPFHVFGPRHPLNKEAVAAALRNPGAHRAQFDVRKLKATQPGLTRAGVSYYLHDPTYAITGRTFADQGNEGNRVPVIYVLSDGTCIILSGHHRAAAALLKGEMLTGLRVDEPSLSTAGRLSSCQEGSISEPSFLQRFDSPSVSNESRMGALSGPGTPTRTATGRSALGANPPRRIVSRGSSPMDPSLTDSMSSTDVTILHAAKPREKIISSSGRTPTTWPTGMPRGGTQASRGPTARTITLTTKPTPTCFPMDVVTAGSADEPQGLDTGVENDEEDRFLHNSHALGGSADRTRYDVLCQLGRGGESDQIGRSGRVATGSLRGGRQNDGGSWGRGVGPSGQATLRQDGKHASLRVVGAIPPGALTFKVSTTKDGDRLTRVDAVLFGDLYVGFLIYYTATGEIYVVDVKDNYQRQGIATQMLAHARTIEPKVHHSEDLTPEGASWSSKVAKPQREGSIQVTASATQQYVNMLADMRRGNGRTKHGDKYDSFDNLIAEEGKHYPKVATAKQFYDKGYLRGGLGLCFMNASNLALKHSELTYVEGYANMGVMAMNHGWCIDKSGKVYDPTWEDGSDYFGVPVPTSFLRSHIVRSEIWGLFSGDPGKRRANWDLLKTGIPKTGARKRKPVRRDPRTGIELCPKKVDGFPCKFLLGHAQGCDVDWNAAYPDEEPEEKPKDTDPKHTGAISRTASADSMCDRFMYDPGALTKFREKHDEGAYCDDVARAVEAKYDFEQVFGLYRVDTGGVNGKEMHSWNKEGYDTIVDFTADQFGDTNCYPRVLRPGDKDYDRYEEQDSYQDWQYEGSLRTGGKNGDLPEGMTLRFRSGSERRMSGPGGGRSGSVSAWVPRPADYGYSPRVGESDKDLRIGELSWTASGDIAWVNVYEDEHQRRGVASSMLEYARTIRPDLRHSTSLNEDSKPWAKHTGGKHGDFPEGITFEHSTGQDMQVLRALLPFTGSVVGFMNWMISNGSINSIRVSDAWRRKGIATAMLAEARKIDPRVHHSDDLTLEGEAWSKRVAGKNGDLPDGLTFEHKRLDSRPDQDSVTAYVDGDRAGWIRWSINDGEVKWVGVSARYERRGIATALLEQARAVDAQVHHSNNLSDAAKAWVKHTASLPSGYTMEVREQPRDGYDFTVTVLVFHGDKAIAGLGLNKGVDNRPRHDGPMFYVEAIQVYDEHQRKGIASEMYAEIHRRYPDVPVMHSWGPAQSGDARALTEILRKTYGPRMHLGIAGLQESLTTGYDGGGGTTVPAPTARGDHIMRPEFASAMDKTAASADDAMDTTQQKAILRGSATARKVRQRYPAGTRVVSVGGLEDKVLMHGVVVRHVPGTDAQGGYLRIEWDSGVTGRITASNLKREDSISGETKTASTPKRWVHSCSARRADEVEKAGHFPSDYSPKSAYWGVGVYMCTEAELGDLSGRFGDAVIELEVTDRLYDKSGETWGWGPLTIADNMPPKANKVFWAEYDKERYGPGGAGPPMRAAITSMGYGGVVFTGDNDLPWAVAYHPEHVKFIRRIK